MAIYSVQVSPGASFPAADSPSVTIPFEPKRVTIVNEDTTAANVVEFSYDGVTVHGAVKPTINPQYESRQLPKQLWLRRSAGTPSVRITAES